MVGLFPTSVEVTEDTHYTAYIGLLGNRYGQTFLSWIILTLNIGWVYLSF